MLRAIATILILFAVPAFAQDADRGMGLYQEHCATCHGLEGRGDGPMAGVLLIAPVNLTELAAANGGSFPLDRVIRRIDGRDPLVSHGSPMPVYGGYFAESFDTPVEDAGERIMTSAPVLDLVAYLRGFQRAE